MSDERAVIRVETYGIAKVEHWLERDGKLIAVYVDMYLTPRFAEVTNGRAVPMPTTEEEAR